MNLRAQSFDTAVHIDGVANWNRMLRNPASSIELPEPSRKFNWEFLGPSSMPSEEEQSGTGIPAYARGRGAGTGRINYLYAHRTDAGKLWACSPTGGLWYTLDEGLHWLEGGTDRLPVSGVSSVAVNEQKPSQWVIATGDGDDQFVATNGFSWRVREVYGCVRM